MPRCSLTQSAYRFLLCQVLFRGAFWTRGIGPALERRLFGSVTSRTHHQQYDQPRSKAGPTRHVQNTPQNST